ncbi:MAG: hypothetical protein LBI86_00655 [Treponema sp.]|nr:hypothetical protein [Treponema sp.]
MNKWRMYVFLAAEALFFSGCNFFQTSLAEYLHDTGTTAGAGQTPPNLRLAELYVTYNGGRYSPVEPLDEIRDTFTIFVPPASLAASGSVPLTAVPAVASSTVTTSGSLFMPLRAVVLIEGKFFTRYRNDRTILITVTTAEGLSKAYTVTAIWAEFITRQEELAAIGTDTAKLGQDYYLKPGSLFAVSNWVPIGAAGDYSSGNAFTGSVRGNGSVIQVNSFKNPPSSPVQNQGVFLRLQNAGIEDLHVHLAGGPVNTGALNAGGLAGTAENSFIWRVKVSGIIRNDVTAGSNSVHTGGIAGLLSKGALVADSLSAVEVRSRVSTSAEHYIGGITGWQEAASGGFIFKSCSRGNVIAEGVPPADTPGTVGGITGGGGNMINTSVMGCVVLAGALRAEIASSSPGSVNRILGRWSGPTLSAYNTYNYYNSALDMPGAITGSPSGLGGIEGTPRSLSLLQTRTEYEALGWDFTAIWKMGPDSYPVLMWE